MIYKKNIKIELCRGLTGKDYKCRCEYEDCRALIVSQQFLEAYEHLISFIEVIPIVLSGHRCSHHNFDVGGVAQSQHLLGNAIDIAAANILDVWHLDRVKFIAKQSGFTYVKHYEKQGFFHFGFLGV